MKRTQRETNITPMIQDATHLQMQYTDAVPQHTQIPDTPRCSTQMQCPNMKDTEIQDARHFQMQYTDAVPQHATHRDSRCNTLPDVVHRCSAPTCRTQRFTMQDTSRCNTQMQCLNTQRFKMRDTFRCSTQMQWPNIQDTEIHDVRHFQMQYTDAVPQHATHTDSRCTTHGGDQVENI